MLMKFSYDSDGRGPVLGSGPRLAVVTAILQLQIVVLNRCGENLTAFISNDMYGYYIDPYPVDRVAPLSLRPPDALPLAF